MALITISVAAFFASLLTFFSGFGLGTLLMPVVALFLPVPVAVTITAAVHFASKLFKVAMLWCAVDRTILLRFGVPALCAAVPGAWLLSHLSILPPLMLHPWGSITPLGIIVGLLLIFFATAEWVPFLQRHMFRRLGLLWGGVLSGFFGGLSGHQGAFRSAFLIQGGLSETAFVATNAAIAVLVDGARLTVYGLSFSMVLQSELPLVSAATLAAFFGVMLGTRLLKRVTLQAIQRIIVAMMYLFGTLLITGVI